MASKTSIEWTGFSWNPIAGCSVLSPGCTNCYAMKTAARLSAIGQPLYKGLTKSVNGHHVWTGEMRKAARHVLLDPLRRKKPTTYFVNSMSDLFHENVPDDWIDEIFAVMALCPQHTFQVLTKRARRMREYFDRFDAPHDHNCADMIADAAAVLLGTPGARGADRYNGKSPGWPLPNVWLGVSTERQQEADERIPLLLQTPAAIRFISAEPLLGPIDLENLPWPKSCDCDEEKHQPSFNVLNSSVFCDGCCEGPERMAIGKLDWVIVGGESSPRARPMHPAWARSLRDQCFAAGIPFFFKQWGEWAPFYYRDDGYPRRSHEFGDATVYRIGKSTSGRVLDNAEHNAMPRATP